LKLVISVLGRSIGIDIRRFQSPDREWDCILFALMASLSLVTNFKDSAEGIVVNMDGQAEQLQGRAGRRPIAASESFT
jgi:hypothetical protein